MPEQICEAELLIEQYPDVLTSLPGRTDVIRYNIKLLTAEPVRSKGYPIPYKTHEVLETEIQEMLDLGVIEPSVIPYSSPIVLVPQIDGSVRFWFLGRAAFCNCGTPWTFLLLFLHQFFGNWIKVPNSMQNQCQTWRR